MFGGDGGCCSCYGNSWLSWDMSRSVWSDEKGSGLRYGEGDCCGKHWRNYFVQQIIPIYWRQADSYRGIDN